MVNANSSQFREGLGRVRSNKRKMSLQNVSAADSHSCQVKTVDVCPLDVPPLSRKQNEYWRSWLFKNQQGILKKIPPHKCVYVQCLLSYFHKEGWKWEKRCESVFLCPCIGFQISDETWELRYKCVLITTLFACFFFFFIMNVMVVS